MYSFCLFVCYVSLRPSCPLNYSIALARFSTTTDEVYDHLTRSHDSNEADFVAVEATVLNVSSCVRLHYGYHDNNKQMRDAISELRRTVAMSVVCVCLSVCLSVLHCVILT